MMPTSGSRYRWRLGELEIVRVLEFEAALFEPAVLYPDVTSEMIERHRSWLEPTLINPASGLMVFAFHSTVIKTPQATILVDTCSGNDKERPTSHAIIERIGPISPTLPLPALRRKTSTMCCARICTPITSVGTLVSLTVAGCRRSPMPAICLRGKNGSTGSVPNCVPATLPIRIMRTACCQ